MARAKKSTQKSISSGEIICRVVDAETEVPDGAEVSTNGNVQFTFTSMAQFNNMLHNWLTPVRIQPNEDGTADLDLYMFDHEVGELEAFTDLRADINALHGSITMLTALGAATQAIAGEMR